MDGTLIFDLREIPEGELCVLVSSLKIFKGITLVNKGKDYTFDFYKSKNEFFENNNKDYFATRNEYLNYLKPINDGSKFVKLNQNTIKEKSKEKQKEITSISNSSESNQLKKFKSTSNQKEKVFEL